MDELRAFYPDRVPIHLSNGIAYVWESRDVELVRAKHNLCGLLSGTLPLIPQQNVFLGLPLRLLPEEVVLLLRRGAAILIDEAHAYLPPTEAEREALLEREAQRILAQKEATILQQEEHRKRVEDAMHGENAVDSKALERRRARQASKQEKDAAAPSAVPKDPASVLERIPYVHYTQGSSKEVPGYRPLTRTMQGVQDGKVNAYDTLMDAALAEVWEYPKTAEQRARCAVFEDLHGKGYFMSTGLRFGGDFVVYPGDPLRYHSHFTVTVLTTPDQPLAAFHIIASGRLGTAVKKSHLLSQAYLTSTDDEVAWKQRTEGLDDASDAAARSWGGVQHWSLAWAGFGT